MRPRVDILAFNFYDWDGGRVLAGGAERYLRELAKVIVALGCQPRIVQNAHREFTRNFDGVPVLGVPASSTFDMAEMSAGFSSAVQGAALVIASPVELAAGIAGDIPVVGINHGVHWDYPNNRLELHAPALTQRVVEAVRRCHACVAVDTNFYNWLRCFDAEAASRVRVIPNFVDLRSFRPTPKAFDAERLQMLFPRRLCVERGFEILIEAFEELLPRHPCLDLHICGFGAPEQERAAQDFVARHPGQVRFSQPGFDAMPAAYAECQVVLIPTVASEGMSLSCIEAMATRNAVVTTPVGGLGNLVIDGHNGIVIPPTAAALVSAVERLVRDRALALRLATTALDVVPAFALERWVSRWEALLRELFPWMRTAGDERDTYAPVDWPHGFEAERDAMRAQLDSTQAQLAHVEAELTFRGAELAYRDAELAGIKSSTGWAVLQAMYKVRFAMFPRGGRRERAAKWAMHRGRALARRMHPQDRPATVATVELPARVPGARIGEASAYTIVCLPIIEWAFRRQRPQQMARMFADRGHQVVFVRHSFGERLSSREVEPGVTEVELPGPAGANPYRDALDPEAAARMADALLAWVTERGGGRIVCILQLPFWAGIADRLREATGCDVVYDCMDLHAGFSSNTAEGLQEEGRLLGSADLVVCSSQFLLDHVVPQARRTALVRNGVDYDTFAAVAGRVRGRDGRLVVGYYGAIADWFNSELVAEIARLRPGWRLVLIGSTWSADTAPLSAMPNIELTGEKPYSALPGLIADWDCCVIPFRHTPLTDATNPVKVYEMLAAGKPIVSVRLPELEAMHEAGLVDFAENAEAFVAAIEVAADANDPAHEAARRRYARQHTWQVRADAFIGAVAALQPLVSIVVVTFNNHELNVLCLESILHDTCYPNIEVIVVDNASADATPSFLEGLAAREPRVRVLLNKDNRGFAAANNQGMALARGAYCCLLNNDTVVHGSWLDNLMAHLRRDARLGMVGPVTNAIANEAQIPVGYASIGGMPAWAEEHVAKHTGLLTTIPMLAFFCVLIPRWVWHAIGPLDERFGVGMFEDDDYNRRVRAAGLRIGLAHDSFVHHWQRASFKLLGEEEYLRIYRENEGRYRDKWVSAGEAAVDPLDPLRRVAATARGTVIFAPSVGWSIPLAQRPHHMARVLAADGYAVVFDCSNAADEVDTLREVEPRLFLYKGQPGALSGLARTTLWTFSYNYDYRDAFSGDIAVIYDWIDDLAVFPYDPKVLARLHERALLEADIVICVARRLVEQARIVRSDAMYVPNGVEQHRFERVPQPDPVAVDRAFGEVLAAGRPIAGYYGALAHWFDYALLSSTARARPDWSFVLIGPDHDGSLARSGLERLSNVHLLGPRPYEALPAYLHRFDVATIPFAINDITRATSPLKLYEYFAAGKPVISTPMPECMAFAEVRIIADADGFSAALDEALRNGRDPAFRSAARAVADRSTWRARVAETMGALEARRDGWEPPPPPQFADFEIVRGVCNICGRHTRFFRDAPSLDRESLACEHCLATSRYRSIARGVLRAIESRTGIRSSSIAGLPLDAGDVSFAIYDTQPAFAFAQCAYPLPDMLRSRPWISMTVSSYRPDQPPGMVLSPGVVNQSLESLSFADASFDLVLTSDVMEHVRLDHRAHAEILRVLKPGGVYAFTVPHFRDRRETLVRVSVADPDDPSKDVFLTPPEYHGDANSPEASGVLSYRSYGTILDDDLAALGFDVHYSAEDDPQAGILRTELFYCVRR